MFDYVGVLLFFFGKDLSFFFPLFFQVALQHESYLFNFSWLISSKLTSFRNQHSLPYFRSSSFFICHFKNKQKKYWIFTSHVRPLGQKQLAQRTVYWWNSLPLADGQHTQGDQPCRCKSISKGAQYVTPERKIYCEKVKMCRFSSGNWFFCTKFVQLAMPGKRHNRVVHLPKRV